MTTDERGAARGREVVTAVRRFWWVVLLVALPLVAGTAVYASSLPDEYEVEAVVAFVPRERPETGADLVELLLPKYAVYARSDQTLRRVAGRLDEDPEEVQAALHAVVPPDTAQLELTLDLGNARRSARMANAIADDVVRFTRSDPVLSATVITDAVPPEEPTGPSRLAFVAVGAVVALVAGIFGAVLVHRRRPARVHARETGAVHHESRARPPLPRERVPETTAP
jgi:capsular polysaccharide biosynthesis protein